MSSRGELTLAVEPASEVPRALYVSRRPVTRELSDLPLVARRLYALVSLRALAEELLADPVRERGIRQAEARLGSVNAELRLPFKSRKPYEGQSGREIRLARQRDQVLAELGVAESEAATERLDEVEPWARAYVQTTDALTAYRVYRFESGQGYTAYAEDLGEARPHVSVVCGAFDDVLAKGVIEAWCGAEERASS
jgi:hypothetical protein